MITTDKPKATVWQIVRTYWTAMRNYPWELAALWSSIVIATATGIFTPLYYKRFFDILAGAAPTDVIAATLVIIILKILALNALIWVFWRIALFLAVHFDTQVSIDLKQSTFNYLLGNSYTFFANNFGGSLVQKTNRLSRSYEALVDNFNWTFIPLVTRVIGITIVLWFYSHFLVFILLVWVVVLALVNFFLAQWKIKYDITAAAQDSITTGVLADAITNHTNIQLFTASRRESRLFQKVTETWRKAYRSAWNIDVIMLAAQGFLVFVMEFLIFYYAVHYWRLGLITIGIFVLIQAYFIQITNAMYDFGRTMRHIYRSIADAEEIVAILQKPHDIKDIPIAKDLKIKNGEIEFRKVDFSFNETRKVLRKINLKVEAGEKVALIGPSGAGKSTMVKLLLRLHDIESGAILIDGQDIHAVTQESLRENLSLVPQDPILFHRTLFENIRYGKPDATKKEVERAAKLAHCDEFIDLLPDRYETYVGERGIKLSGGERQRVAIARAILKNAPILILDEATSSLDSHSEGLIQGALRNLMKGKTVIVIAHRLSTIRTMDRIVVIDSGRIKEEGTHVKLLENPRSLYARLWKLQAGGFLRPEEDNV